MPHIKRYRTKPTGSRALTLHGGATGKLADQAYAVPSEGDVFGAGLKVSLGDNSEKVESHLTGIVRVARAPSRLLKRQAVEQAASTRAARSVNPQVTVLRNEAFDAVLRDLEHPAGPSEASRQQVARHRLWRK